jgi:hypothetical protein
MTEEITARLLVGDKTQEVGMTVDNLMKEKKEVIDALVGGHARRAGDGDDIARRLLLKELLITAYITGFFAGTSSAHRDIAKTESN